MPQVNRKWKIFIQRAYEDPTPGMGTACWSIVSGLADAVKKHSNSTNGSATLRQARVCANGSDPTRSDG